MSINIDDFAPLTTGGDEGEDKKVPSFFSSGSAANELFDNLGNDDDEDEPGKNGGSGTSDSSDSDDGGSEGGSDAGDNSDDDDGDSGAGNSGKDKQTASAGAFDEIINDEEEEDEEDDDDEKASKKKTSNEPLAKVFKKLIEDETLLPFDEDKPLEEYTQKDFQELIKANFETTKETLKEEVTNEFYESLPAEMQTAMEYIANGGTNIKGLFANLSQSLAIKDLDPKKNSEQIVRQYLNNTNFGDEDTIADQIQEWKESGLLAKKAERFHPTLVKQEEENTKEAVKKAEQDKQKRTELAEAFQEGLIENLQKKDLNGIKLDKKLRESIAEGLLQTNHQSELTGRKTNELFYLIEKYQVSEKRPDIIAEALLLLRDPSEYKKLVATEIKNETNKETVRKLKTAQQKAAAQGSATADEDDDEPAPKRKTIKRKPKSFFSA